MSRRQGVVGFAVVAVALALLAPSTASALRLKRVATGFASPVHVTSNRRDPGGTIYVVEQGGRIWRVRNGRKRLFLGIRSLVSTGGERGLLSVAFPPDYARTRFFYLNYTDNGGDVRVARFRARRDFSRGRRSSRRMLLRVEHSKFGNHNGGLLAFGPNGRLYLSIGDGGGGCDPDGNAQDLSSRKGKLLSVNLKSRRKRWRKEGYGLRNPWRFSFDRANGRLYIADVGQSQWEEISTIWRGRLGGRRENFMWDRYEGRRRSRCDSGGLRGPGRRVRPFFVYDHSRGRCSVTGGHVYRGRGLPARFRGWYFFGDYCSGHIWRLKFDGGRGVVGGPRRVRDTDLNVSSFGEGRTGELYVADHGGSVYRIVRS